MRILLLISTIFISTASFSQNSSGNATISIQKKPLSCFIADASDEVVGKWSPAAAGIWVGIYGLLPFISQLILGILVMKLMPQTKAAETIPVDSGVSVSNERLIPAKDMSLGAISTLDSLVKLFSRVMGTNPYQESVRFNTYQGNPNSMLDFPQGVLDAGTSPGSSNMPSAQTITAVLTALITAGGWIAAKYARGVCNYEMQP